MLRLRNFVEIAVRELRIGIYMYIIAHILLLSLAVNQQCGAVRSRDWSDRKRVGIDEGNSEQGAIYESMWRASLRTTLHRSALLRSVSFFSGPAGDRCKIRPFSSVYAPLYIRMYVYSTCNETQVSEKENDTLRNINH